MLLDEGSLERIVKTSSIEEGRGIQVSFVFGSREIPLPHGGTRTVTTAVEETGSMTINRVLRKIIDDVEDLGPVNIYLYAALYSPKFKPHGVFETLFGLGGLGIPVIIFERLRAFYSSVFENHITSKLEKRLKDRLATCSQGFTYIPTFQYGHLISENCRSYVVSYTPKIQHYHSLRKILEELGKTEEKEQLERAFAEWLEQRGKQDSELGDGGRCVALRMVQDSGSDSDGFVRVQGTRVEPLEREARIRTGIRRELLICDSEVELPKTLGLVRTTDGKAARYDERLRGITLDQALRSKQYHDATVDFLPEIAAGTAELHHAVARIHTPQKQFNAKEFLRERFDDVPSCYCQDRVDAITRRFLVNLRIFDDLEQVQGVINLDSHPKQYLVVLEWKKSKYHITSVGRVDFESERMSSVPFVLEVANIYRYGDYCGESFEQDFRGLDRFIRRYNELHLYSPARIAASAYDTSLQIAYLHGVILRGLSFYNAWLKPTRRRFMLGRVPEILANIEHAITAIKEKDPSTFEQHQDQYLGLLGVLPDLKKAATKARYW